MLEGKIDVVRGFQTSVNIAFDLNNDEKIRNFIPTMSSLEIIEDVLYSTRARATSRSRILIGAYGRGKSHIILVLVSLLLKKDLVIFEGLLNKIKETNSIFYEFLIDYLESDKKLMPIVVTGNNSSLTQSFLNALQLSLKNENLSDLMPDTHFIAAIRAIELWKSNYVETYNRFIDELNTPVEKLILSLKEFDVNAYETFVSLYPKLTSGSEFNPFLGFDVVELYENVVKQLKTKGYNGVFIIYDEFSKYLESSLSNATISDTKLLQDFAEKCDRSENNQMHLMLISHKDVSNYIDRSLPKEKVDGWRGVSGRFKHITLHNNFSQIYEIISSVIKKDAEFWNDFSLVHNQRFNELEERYTENGMLDNSIAKIAVQGCYPMHPLSTFILPRISEKVAQNERTLFTFLSMDSKNTLLNFIVNASGEFPLLTPDYIYDYFEMLLRKEHYNTETYKLYRLTSKVLSGLDSYSLEAKIIKTIALIYIVEQYEKLPPNYDAILNAFDFTYEIEAIRTALMNLINKECIVYLKRSNGFLKIKESSGVDIQKEIEKQIEKNKATESVKDILNKTTFENYIYPTAYNDEHEITRYFDFIFISSSEFFTINNWTERIAEITSEGVIFAIIPNHKEEIDKIRNKLLNETNGDIRIVFTILNSFVDIEQSAYEYDAVKEIKKTVIDDPILLDEYEIYLEDLEDVVNSYIASYSRPELGKAEYYYSGAKLHLKRRAQLSLLLSKICKSMYPWTPIINNESINKNDLPTVAVNSRSKILSKLLDNELGDNLGLSGSGQDVSIMRSTLIQTGILATEEGHTKLILSTPNCNMRLVLSVIKEFFATAGEKGKSFEDLYRILTIPSINDENTVNLNEGLPKSGFGLKKGVIPIYLAVVLHDIKKHLVIRNKNQELKITSDLLNSINEMPQNYMAYLENWNEEKSKYIEELITLFSPFVLEKEKEFNTFAYIAFAMYRWHLSIPPYSKERKLKYLGKGKSEPIRSDYVKFAQSLKLQPTNAHEYLFEKLFEIFNYNSFSIGLIDNIKNAKLEIDNAKNDLIKMLIEDVKFIFNIEFKKQSTLSSTIKDWYEHLKEETVNHLFSNNEDKVLLLMKNITSDENIFIERLGKIVTGLRIDDWKNETVHEFYDYLIEMHKTVTDFDSNQVDRIGIASEVYKLTFVLKSGEEVVKTFEKSKYSDRAKLLLNSITTELEEMGQSISEQEKRQVLMDILEKMC